MARRIEVYTIYDQPVDRRISINNEFYAIYHSGYVISKYEYYTTSLGINVS